MDQHSSKIYVQVAKKGKSSNWVVQKSVVILDPNLDQAVDGIMGAAFGSAGERCMAISVAVAVDVAFKLVTI